MAYNIVKDVKHKKYVKLIFDVHTRVTDRAGLSVINFNNVRNKKKTKISGSKCTLTGFTRTVVARGTEVGCHKNIVLQK